MRITKGSDYALHAMQYLISKRNDKPINVKELSETLNVSVTYLSKLLTQLSKARYIEGASGANGGYFLKNGWENIRIYDIITTIDGYQSALEDSFNHGSECKIQKILLSAENEMTKSLKNKTLKDLT